VTKESPISVLIVDDSALMRNIISRIIDDAPGLTVAGKAMNGHFALQKIPKLKPDVILLDLEMPQIDGISFLKERKKRGITIPVVILSSIAKKGAKITMEALSLGASDFILKPSGSASDEIRTVSSQIVQIVKGYGSSYKLEKGEAVEPIPPQEAKNEPAATDEPTAPYATKKRKAPHITPKCEPGKIELVAIGISTGGPNALRQVFSEIDPDIDVPILVVQHMPAGFTYEFAKSLDKICPLEVKEAAEGDIVKPNRVLIAPGDNHITVERKRLASVAHLTTDPPVNGHRPSADVLFGSVSKQYGNNALAVIMTGMGRDGAQEIGSIYREGSMTLGQGPDSSVVYGMPRVAHENGYLRKVVELNDMAAEISKIVKESRQ